MCFPRSFFEHDIEFLPNAPKELYSKPFPVSGIHLAQLRENINDLCKNGILKPGDSEFVSPCFYVTKKMNETETANVGVCVLTLKR